MATQGDETNQAKNEETHWAEGAVSNVQALTMALQRCVYVCRRFSNQKGWGKKNPLTSERVKRQGGGPCDKIGPGLWIRQRKKTSTGHPRMRAMSW